MSLQFEHFFAGKIAPGWRICSRCIGSNNLAICSDISARCMIAGYRNFTIEHRTRSLRQGRLDADHRRRGYGAHHQGATASHDTLVQVIFGRRSGWKVIIHRISIHVSVAPDMLALSEIR